MKTVPNYTEKPHWHNCWIKSRSGGGGAAEPQTTCVTGATSTIGAHVVRRLLRAGHTVQRPSRSGDDDVAYLKAMPGAERQPSTASI